MPALMKICLYRYTLGLDRFVDAHAVLWHNIPVIECVRHQGGHAPEFESAEHLSWMGRILARIHNVGASMNLDQRAQLDVDSLGEIPFGLSQRDQHVAAGGCPARQFRRSRIPRRRRRR